jgi:coatomer subunit beta
MDKPCTLLVHFDKGSAAMANEIKADLEGSDVAAKVEAMKRAVMLLLNGETLPTPARTKCILHSTACVYIRNTC